MRICTVNVPESYLEAIEKLTGDGGLYPSRSELIRVAVREFLIREIKMAKKLTKLRGMPESKPEEIDEEKFVRVPVNTTNEENEPIQDFKTFKIVKRLE